MCIRDRPNIKELQSIVDFAKVDPSIDTTYFPNTKAYVYWSSTSVNSDHAWAVWFDHGYVDVNWQSFGGKDDSAYARAVRSVAPPRANAGLDQVVFASVTLDGSGSSDPDGSIVLWEWSFIHRTSPSYNRFAIGVNPVVTNLASGFYDVTLTVTDNTGGTDTDIMLLGAAGIWDINGDQQLGLEEVIYIMEILSGKRND